MRLIDADALYSETEKKIKANHECRMAVVDDEFLDLINDADTVDAVEVLRCKDCGFAKPVSSGVFMCKFHTVHTITKSSIYYVNPDDFCSYGIRRES